MPGPCVFLLYSTAPEPIETMPQGAEQSRCFEAKAMPLVDVQKAGKGTTSTLHQMVEHTGPRIVFPAAAQPPANVIITAEGKGNRMKSFSRSALQVVVSSNGFRWQACSNQTAGILHLNVAVNRTRDRRVWRRFM